MNTVTQEQVDSIFDESTKRIETFFDKCLVMICKLPNGFILTESSACVDPSNFDVKIGTDICTERIKNKIWELEGYRLQCELNKEEK